jgi:hypothetical protein
LTSTFTILCSQGIVLAADSVGTVRNRYSNEIEKIIPNIQKIYCFSKVGLGVSFWGLGTIQDKPILHFLEKFEDSEVQKTDSLDQVAEKLTVSLGKILPENTNRMGLHLAGYVKNSGSMVPQLRHIFHERWHAAGKFVCENCHKESLAEKGRLAFQQYLAYPTLFNGDNVIANCLINFIPACTEGKQKIEPSSLTLAECIDLAQLVVGVSIQRLQYYVDDDYRKLPKTVGGTVFTAKITQDKGFEWIQKS